MTIDQCVSELISKGFHKSGHFHWWRPGDDQEATLVFVGDGEYRIRYLKD